MNFEDRNCEKRDGLVRLTITPPKLYNAFRALTWEEIIQAAHDTDHDKSIGVLVITGAGDKAFCTCGDQSSHSGSYGGWGVIGLPVEEMQGAIRDCRKPVIARVKGYAIGGGNVLVTVCDSPSRRRTRASGRWDPRWARSIRVGAPPVSRASSGIRGRVKFGTCAGAIPRGTR